jgi:hypothetical protein
LLKDIEPLIKDLLLHLETIDGGIKYLCFELLQIILSYFAKTELKLGLFRRFFFFLNFNLF